MYTVPDSLCVKEWWLEIIGSAHTTRCHASSGTAGIYWGSDLVYRTLSDE